jgi:hypothetical protein
MTDLLLLIALAAPFIVLGAVVTLLVISIGRQTTSSGKRS